MDKTKCASLPVARFGVTGCLALASTSRDMVVKLTCRYHFLKNGNYTPASVVCFFTEPLVARNNRFYSAIFQRQFSPKSTLNIKSEFSI